MRRFWLIVLLVPSLAIADKVIMKDGKIYEGRIMGETSRSILITTKTDKEPRFLSLSDVLTIVREKNPEVPDPERGRYVHLETMLLGNFFSSEEMSLSPAPGISATGGFRLFPMLQAEAGIDWQPGISGQLAVTDGTTFRQYERFYRYSGGFGLRVFPLAALSRAPSSPPPLEPYLLGGYRWSRLNAKGTDDSLKGESWHVGAGLSKKLHRHCYWESRFSYEGASYDRIEFLGQEGTLRPAIGVSSWSLQTGLSWRL